MITESPVDPLDPLQLIARLRRHAQPLIPIPTDQPTRVKRLSGIRAVLFDVYGTLFISASGEIGTSDGEARSQALGQALKALGIPADRNSVQSAAAVLVEVINQRHERLKDRGLEYPEVDIRDVLLEVLHYLRGQGWVADRPTRVFCEVLSVEYESRSNPTWPMPGLGEMLRRLKEREILLGIVSNAQFFTPLLFPAHLGKNLASLGFDPDLCVWSYRHLEAKPSTQLFRQVLQVLKHRGLEPEQVLYVGNDRLNDIWPAARVGMKTALFAGDRRSFRPREGDPRIRNLREDLLLTDLSQLPEVLGSI